MGSIVQALESITSHTYAREVREHGWPPFKGHFRRWHYNEHVIRNDGDLDDARWHMVNKPLK